MTPRRALLRRSATRSATYAPRSLNAPIGWSDSAFRNRRASGGRRRRAASGRRSPRRRSAAAPDVVDGRRAASVGRRSRGQRSRRRCAGSRCSGRPMAAPRAARRRSAGRSGRTRRTCPHRAGRGPRRRSSSCCVGPLAQGQVALLLEDLAGRRGLRPVGHLARARDRLADLLERAARARRAGRACGSASSRSWLTVRRGWYGDRVYSMGSTAEEAQMAIAIDPVCGMEVDTATCLLSFEYEGDDLLVLRQGLPARVQRRPRAATSRADRP